MAFLTPEGGLDDMSDEELEQLIALGIIPDKQSILDQQIKTAEQLRYGNKPEMRHGGRVSTAAHPLEFLAAGLEGHKAGKQLEELRKKQEELLQQQVLGRKTFFDRLRSPSQPPGLGPMPGDEEYL